MFDPVRELPAILLILLCVVCLNLIAGVKYISLMTGTVSESTYNFTFKTARDGPPETATLVYYRV